MSIFLILDEISTRDQGMHTILNNSVRLFFQLTFPAQTSLGMAGEKAFLTSNFYSQGIP